MAHIRLWKVKDAVNAQKLEKILNEYQGSKNVDIISDDAIFQVVIINCDKDSPGSVDRVVNMIDPPVDTTVF